MADNVSVHLRGFKEMRAELDAIDHRLRRATMWALRESARTVSREAKRRAPKDTGALRKGIRPTRNMIREGREYVLRVGPRGEQVHLYAGKIEAQVGYMRDGFNAGEASFAATFARAWERSARKR